MGGISILAAVALLMWVPTARWLPVSHISFGLQLWGGCGRTQVVGCILSLAADRTLFWGCTKAVAGGSHLFYGLQA
jgi:hypothetical protein